MPGAEENFAVRCAVTLGSSSVKGLNLLSGREQTQPFEACVMWAFDDITFARDARRRWSVEQLDSELEVLLEGPAFTRSVAAA